MDGGWVYGWEMGRWVGGGRVAREWVGGGEMDGEMDG